MARKEKKAFGKKMAEDFIKNSDIEGKSMAIMIMNAYIEGRAAGIQSANRRMKMEGAYREPAAV